MINVHCTEEQLIVLRRLSAQTGLSISEHISRAIVYYLAKEKFLDAVHAQTAERLKQIEAS